MSLSSALGNGGVPSGAHSDVLTADPENLKSKRALVEEIKRRGRACVASRSLPEADALYGKGIDVLSSVLDGKHRDGVDDETREGCRKDAAILHSNRSLVRMQMGRVAEALEDADAAIAHDGSYVKAHWRRGQACVGCGDAGGALASFERALELDPGNKALKTEVKSARERKEMEERAMMEAKESAGSPEKDESKEKSPARVPSSSSRPRQKKSADDDKMEGGGARGAGGGDGDGAFTKSDHVRGYKIRSDGSKTSYFDREIGEEARRLIGDIAPKKLESGPSSAGDLAPMPMAAASEGASAWNKAGTWEERDVTPWAKETLTASLLGVEYILPSGSPSPGARVTVTKVSKLEGHASAATARGKKRHIHEFSTTIRWKFVPSSERSAAASSSSMDGEQRRAGGAREEGECTGEMTFPDIDGTITLGDGYDIVGYRVDATSAPGTGPLLDKFVRNGGLRDAMHEAIDGWVRLFRASH